MKTQRRILNLEIHLVVAVVDSEGKKMTSELVEVEEMCIRDREMF